MRLPPAACVAVRPGRAQCTNLWSSMGTSEAASNGSGACSPSGNSTSASEASTADIWATSFCHCSSCDDDDDSCYSRPTTTRVTS